LSTRPEPMIGTMWPWVWESGKGRWWRGRDFGKVIHG
jgi:hypothetical protein